jgi:hypothetical protein
MNTFIALVIVIFTADGPATITKFYDNTYNCMNAEAAMLTKALDEQKVVGWSVPVECKPISESNKV